MKWARFLAGIFIVAVALLAPATLRACPLCADAIANANASSAADDIDNFPAAMNQSIYLMLAVPYTTLGIIGFCIYRGVKLNEAHRKSQEAPPQTSEPI